MESINYNSAGRKHGKDVSHRLKEIDDKFIKNGGEFREVKIGDIFEKLHFQKLPYEKRDLPKEANNDFNLPAVTCQTLNQGISCYVPRRKLKNIEPTVFSNVISIAANGNAPVFYQPDDFMILQDAYVIRFIGQELSDLSYLYFTALLQHILKKYNWSNKSGWEKVKNEIINVPYLNNQIAFSYMDERIQELEQERIQELEAYLVATGLNDYQISKNSRGGY